MTKIKEQSELSAEVKVCNCVAPSDGEKQLHNEPISPRRQSWCLREVYDKVMAAIDEATAANPQP
jgi:hypothetical protein